MNEKRGSLTPVWLPYIIGIVTSLTYLFINWEGIRMGEIIALVVALISVAGSILLQVFQFKKDATKIADVKVDTTEMKPKVYNIHEDTIKIRDKVVEALVPNVQAANQNTAKLNDMTQQLVEDLNYRKRINQEHSAKTSPDFVIAEISGIYQENVRLNLVIREQETTNSNLRYENTSLKEENTRLATELEKYQSISRDSIEPEV